MEVNYYLRRSEIDQSGLCALLISIHWSSERVRKSIGLKVDPLAWDAQKQRPKSTPATAAMRQLLNAIENRFDALYTAHQRSPSVAVVEAALGVIRQQIQHGNWNLSAETVPQPGPVLSPGFRDFVEVYKSDYRGIKSANTLRKYKALVEHLSAFASHEGLVLDWPVLDLTFALRFLGWMTDQKPQGKGQADNTAYGYLSKLGPLLEYAEIKGMPVNREYKLFPSQQIAAPKHWHPEPELEQIVTHKYYGKQNELTAATYALACYTALRVSDLKNFDPVLHIKTIQPAGQSAYRIMDMSHMVKTKEPLSFPISDYAWEIIEKYGGNPWRLLPYQSEQKYNVALKTVGQQARVNRLVSEIVYRGGKRCETIMPMHKAMTSHTARHTFACNSVIRGMAIPILQQVMGHKSIDSTMCYVHLADTWRHDQMRTAWTRPLPPV